MIPVLLNWQRDADGYHLEEMGRYGKSLLRNGGPLIPSLPLADNDLLYAEFAGVKTQTNCSPSQIATGY